MDYTPPENKFDLRVLIGDAITEAVAAWELVGEDQLRLEIHGVSYLLTVARE